LLFFIITDSFTITDLEERENH